MNLDNCNLQSLIYSAPPHNPAADAHDLEERVFE